MKKLISLIVAFVLMLSACALCACDLDDTYVIDVDDTSEATTSEEATDTTGDNSQPADAPVKVDSVNGMNAKQLLEAYMANFEDMKDIDISGTIVETKDGEIVNTTMSMKLGTDAMYVYMNEDGDVTEMTVIDGVLYYNDDGTKIKRTNVSIDELINEVLSDTTGEIADEKVDNAVIYSFGGEYYVDIQLSGEESESFGYEKKEHKLRCYFDAEGKIKRDLVTRDGYTETTVYNSIGKAITISAPADADLYITVGDVDPELYAIYEELISAIDGAQTYFMGVNNNGEQRIAYELDIHGNEWVEVIIPSEDYTIEMWSIDGKGYVSDGISVREETLSQKMLDSIHNAAEFKETTLIDGKVSASEMYSLGLVEGEENVLSFKIGINSSYTFTYDSDMTYIEVLLEDSSDGESIYYVEYMFQFYEGYEMEAPI